ncbi:MAG: T9SS type A sorting domain-containing protein [Bacteroidales bacterium]|jgi:hypothetical protein
MKRLFYFALLGLFALSTQNCFAQWTGAGTSTSPYQINNATDLGTLSNNVRGGNTYSNTYFILMNNLDLTGVTNFIPIGGWNSAGTSSSESNYFNGNFNGNGKVIKNLTILKDSTVSTNDYVGLFGRIGANGLVKKLGIVNARTRGHENVGTICGRIDDGTIENCYSMGLVGGNTCVGGLIGNSDGGIVRNCYSTANVYGVIYVGGFAGNLNYANTQYCYSAGNVTGSTNTCAFGHATWGTNFYQYSMSESVLQGSIGNNAGYTLTHTQMTNGSLVSLLNTNQTPLVFCHDSLNVNQGYPILVWQYQQLVTGVYSQPATDIYGLSAKINGMVILVHDTLVTKGFLWKKVSQVNYDTIFVSGNNNMSQSLTNLILNTEYVYKAFLNTTSQSYLGDEIRFKTLPILGQGISTYPFEIQDTSDLIYLSNYVNSQNSTQGLYYKLTNNIDMAGVNNFIPIGSWNSEGTSYVESNIFNGKFDGNNKIISNLRIVKDSSSSLNSNIGLFGMIGANAEIKNLGVVNARIRGYENVGAICGRIIDGTIINCFTTKGLISGTNYIGGLCGYSEGVIKKSYSKNTVNGFNYVGGFAGNLSYATTENCYSSGNIYGGTNVCGFAYTTSGVNNHLYYRNGNVQQGYISLGDDSGVSKTVAEMYNASFVTLLNTGIDTAAFKADLGIINDSLPLLKWQYVKPIITKQANNITAISARLNAQITDLNITFDSVGFYYKAVNSNNWTSVLGNYFGGNNIKSNIVGLIPNTNYQFMAYMIKDTNVYLGDTLNFYTPHLPILVSTDSALYINSTSVNFYGTLDIGSHTFIRKGFEYKLRNSGTYTIINIPDSNIAFESIINGLLPNNNYTFRAFVESELGIQYGENINFVIIELGLSFIDQLIQTSIYPNPTANQAKLQLSGINKEVKLMIIDVNGRIINTQILKPSNNNIEIAIDLTSLPRGIYYIKLQSDNLNKTEKLIKM